ncbi:hypothetical protein KIH27_15670 [Mycobacterium sp. M1]|uniref:GP55 protein n=1 Tax=Mycolicibacter acidiphilus TaxID=2835306 RepID=A0ABS5RNA9_9MYCO|nr:hypothetical protein [Mycolicibacter acidiphilus]MBS9535028.1 hypothetical protein [Mycolicibacter acidiphilus]
MQVLVATTLLAVLGSLWIRRDTWRSWWEAGLTGSIMLQGCAVLCVSPWVSTVAGPTLHGVLGRWNVEHLLGHLCLIVAAAAIVYHCLTRLADPELLTAMFTRSVVAPLNLGIPLLVAAFLLADEEPHTDLFAAPVRSIWFGVYWLVLGVLLTYLLGYARRVLLALRSDPRSRATANIYLAGAGLGMAACAVQVATAWVGVDVSLPVWCCMCLGVMCFAYGSGRSWQARVDWFIRGPRPPRQPTPPQPAA